MNRIKSTLLGATLALSVLAVSGCTGETKPPPPASADMVPLNGDQAPRGAEQAQVNGGMPPGGMPPGGVAPR